MTRPPGPPVRLVDRQGLDPLGLLGPRHPSTTGLAVVVTILARAVPRNGWMVSCLLVHAGIAHPGHEPGISRLPLRVPFSASDSGRLGRSEPFLAPIFVADLRPESCIPGQFTRT